MPGPPHGGLLFQADTRVMRRALSDRLGRPARFDDIEESWLDRLAAQGFAWLYLLGVWSTGDAGRQISRANPAWRAGYQALLPDLEERDICGSCFAITGYEVDPSFGGDDALVRLRERLAARGIRLMLDFVPNHVAFDHPWVTTRPTLLMSGTPAQHAAHPANYVDLDGAIFAHGRDPNFPGWPDTLQLDYTQPATAAAMTAEVLSAAGLCDGLRCDMAMLLLPEVFERTWGKPAAPFWAEAIGAVRARHPDFVFMAEVYWGLEPDLLRFGFDLAYDKTLYDRAASGDAAGIRAHLGAPVAEQQHLARFLENHDEPRAAAIFPWDKHRAAAVLTFGVPGLRFFHEGQLEGRKRQGSVHLERIPAEPPDPVAVGFYADLLAALHDEVLHDGAWSLLEAQPAWDGNPSCAGFVAFSWEGADGARRLGVVNFQPNQAQCYVRLHFTGLGGRHFALNDLLGPALYERDGDDLLGRGMYFDMPAWGTHLFALKER